jgi:protein TonB
MPRDLFGDVTRPSISVGNRKWYTVPVSLLSHFAIVVAIVLVPLLAPAWMPNPFQGGIAAAYIDLVPPTPPLPPSKPRQIDVNDPPPARGISVDAPAGINPERPSPEGGWETPLPTGTVVGVFDNIVAPPPVAAAAPPAPVRVGGAVRTPQKIHDVSPVYPPIAQSARVQGIVIIEATIGEDGEVTNARILRSVPLLDQAAIEAVRQWRYAPSMLNGVPVPVIMTVTVNFTLR